MHMTIPWFRKKTRLQKLQEQYALLMRKSYKMARTDQEKSTLFQNQAKAIFEEINNILKY